MTTTKADVERAALIARIEATGFRSPLLVNESAEALRSLAEGIEAEQRRYAAAGFVDASRPAR